MYRENLYLNKSLGICTSQILIKSESMESNISESESQKVPSFNYTHVCKSES